jgi:hypothetical protein
MIAIRSTLCDAFHRARGHVMPTHVADARWRSIDAEVRRGRARRARMNADANVILRFNELDARPTTDDARA